MPGTLPNPMRCPKFEALMAEALDGLLPEAEQQRFQEHRLACPLCAGLFAEAEAGRALLRSLEEVAPPPEMVEQILAATSHPAPRNPAAQLPGIWNRISAWLVEAGRMSAAALAAMAQPRFAMSFAMAFFSIAMLLNLTGVQIRDVRSVELRPATFVRAYEQATGKLERYYENIRIVYEIQSRVQELRQSTTEGQPAEPDNKVQPARPTGGLEPGRSTDPSSTDAWLRHLPSAQERLTEEGAVRARVEALSAPDTHVGTHSDSPVRSTL
jgi:hypothetical protein